MARARRLGLETEALEPPPERGLSLSTSGRLGRKGEEVGRSPGLLALEREVEGGDEPLRSGRAPSPPLAARQPRHGRADERQAGPASRAGAVEGGGP